mgnify:CR=1 FL=1
MVADINSWNERIIAEFRANAGHIRWNTDEDDAAGRPIPPQLAGFGELPGVPIILVHNIGAKSGQERVNPMIYQPVGNGFAVFAAYGGSPHHPAWYRNLVANPAATVEVGREAVEMGTEKLPVVARVAEGDERDRIWAKQLTPMPALAEFEAAAGRQIPVVVLERVDSGSSHEKP